MADKHFVTTPTVQTSDGSLVGRKLRSLMTVQGYMNCVNLDLFHYLSYKRWLSIWQHNKEMTYLPCLTAFEQGDNLINDSTNWEVTMEGEKGGNQ